MLDRIRSFFVDRAAAPETAGAEHSLEEETLAAAALLVEAGRMDRPLEGDERQAIAGLLQEHFRLSDSETATLMDTAVRESEESVELSRFIEAINSTFSEKEKVDLMEMLWQVAYHDGELHPLEGQLARRAAGLLHVSDYHSGKARQRALARLGLDSA